VPIYPCLSRFRELALLAMVYRFDRIAEFISAARFHLYECNEIVLLRNEIDIAAAAPKSSRYDLPTALL
jgi:hypothetical protein